jgi:hypothetical protein
MAKNTIFAIFLRVRFFRQAEKIENRNIISKIQMMKF